MYLDFLYSRSLYQSKAYSCCMIVTECHGGTIESCNNSDSGRFKSREHTQKRVTKFRLTLHGIISEII